jgi:hypothetical protein
MKCGMTAIGRFTWPGRPESFVCAAHEPAVVRVADAIGLPLQIVHLEPSEMAEHVCQQTVTS